jgi:glucosamine 6-phosphate synthetase-like amidotransferase/phosphosugar isomerase protein
MRLATTPICFGLSAVQDANVMPVFVEPLAYIVTGQLIAHFLALQKRLDTDQPRGLSKVTRTHSRRSDSY